uniref:RING-type domain-containing protein n=1 Tax=Lotharella oceanica TaxID=641309 RepID=A0A7S2TYS9_9EUKA|mmetsp:Transcript_36046/g.66624  ORF Transcript_36046/g.66624 Transcript_36046/m.66624 type:complete len:444 (+) Transcript_36046:131-1462(+)
MRRRLTKRSRSWTPRDFQEEYYEDRRNDNFPKRRRTFGIPVVPEEERKDPVEAGSGSGLSSLLGDPEDEVEVQEDKKHLDNVLEEKQERKPNRNMVDSDDRSILECPVCRGLLDNPVTLKCGHSLCEECMISYLESGIGRCRCPAGCQTPIPFDLPPVNITLRRMIQTRFPPDPEREEPEDGKALCLRKEMIQNSAAICALLREGSEGRQLEVIRRDIRYARAQDLVARQNAVRVRLTRGDAAANAPTGNMPVTIIWMFALVVCTVWASASSKMADGLWLDWDKVRNKGGFEYLRMLTTFVTMGKRSDILMSSFSLSRLHFQKTYEREVGTAKYLRVMASGIVVILLHDYIYSEQDRGIHFLSHQLILHMFTNYCLERPVLLFILLWLAQCESFFDGRPSRSMWMFILMVLPSLMGHIIWNFPRMARALARRMEYRRAVDHLG